MKTGNDNYIYKSDLGKACFQHDVAYVNINIWFKEQKQTNFEPFDYHRSLVTQGIQDGLVARLLSLSCSDFFHYTDAALINLHLKNHFQATLLPLCHVTCNKCSFQQMKLNINMTFFLTFSTFTFSNAIFIRVLPWSFVNDQ